MTHISQKQRIFGVLLAVYERRFKAPEEFFRRHKSGDGLSGRYFKHIMLVSECNGRLSELRAQLRRDREFEIEESIERDAHGFSYHRLKRLVPAAAMTMPEMMAASQEAVAAFDAA